MPEVQLPEFENRQRFYRRLNVGLDLRNLTADGCLNVNFYFIFIAVSLLMSCRLTSGNLSSEILSLETSKALDESCQRDSVTASADELNAAINLLGTCLGSTASVKQWTHHLNERIEMNWPKDFLGRGEESKKCLVKLTRGVQMRYLESLAQACDNSTPPQKREILAALSENNKESCFDMVSMTADGCFVVKGCRDALTRPSDFGDYRGTARPQLTLCSQRIQSIHGIKDPSHSNLLYNYSYVSELTGSQSSNRITYGPPNCHGVAQAAAGGVLDDIRLSDFRHARLANEGRCKVAVTNFFERHKASPISEIPMSPGGVMINMKYEQCSASDCGRASLWVDDCPDQDLELAVFVDGMCINCWENLLGSKGLKRRQTHYHGKQLIPGCVLTTQDHSVMVVGKSQGMCFFYEATSPYGPPQIRAVPCPVLNQKFSRQYCPDEPSIQWSIR
jgi:hypothetical protein